MIEQVRRTAPGLSPYFSFQPRVRAGGDPTWARDYKLKANAGVLDYSWTAAFADLLGPDSDYATTVLGSERIYLPASSSFLVSSGSLTLWICPFWDGDDDTEHYLFSNSYDSDNYLKLYKNTSNSLLFIHKAAGTTKQVEADISSWSIGEWHEVTAAYDTAAAHKVALTIDSVEVDYTEDTISALAGLATNTDIGNSGGGSQFNGLVSGSLITAVLTKTANAESDHYTSPRY